jgi:ABC transport permease subunit
VLAATALGTLVDAALMAAGAFAPLSALLWMPVLWAMLASALPLSLRWLNCGWIAAGFGAVGGVLAYAGGFALGALQPGTLDRGPALSLVALAWAAAMPALVFLRRELGPVLTALMIAGRSGSSMATTLGTMRVTEQIDAMEVMAADPVHYLVTPRLFATLIMSPLLNMLFVFIGMVGAYFVAVNLKGVDPGLFMGSMDGIVVPTDLIYGGIKAAVFGLAIAAIGCYKGYYASGGAKGVGEATTNAVVLGSVSVLVLNYFLTAVMFG